ncbi:MAG: polysaccharide biosynthesis tyrosine autokinase [Pseudomonadota bacterium]
MSDRDRHRHLQPYPVRQFSGDRQIGVPGARVTQDRSFPPPPLQDPLNNDGQSFTDYLDIVLRHRRLVLAVFVCALVAAVVYALAATPIFTSHAVIELEQQQKDGNKESMYENQAYSDYQSYFLTQQGILTSRHLVESLIDRLNLQKHKEFADKDQSIIGRIRGTVSEWTSSIMSEGAEGPRADPKTAKRNVLCKTISKRITVKPVKKSNLMEVGLDAADPKLAQQMLTNLISLYFQQNLENRRKQSLQAADWLKVEVEKSEKKLREAQTKLVEFTIDHGIVDSSDGGLSQVLSVVNKTMESHVKSQETRAKIQALRMKGSSEQGSLLPEGMKDEYIGKLKQELAIMEAEYSQMKGVYSANYPKMKMLEKKIRFLRERISGIEESLVSSALDSAKTEERLVEQTYETARAEADRVKSLESKYSLLKKDAETNAEFHKILLKEYKQMDIRARTISNNVRVVDAPDQPTEPSKPKRKLIVLVGAMLGLMGGLAAAFAANALDQTIHSAQEIERGLNVTRLGIVPDTATLPEIQGVNMSNEVVDFVAYRHPKSPMSDAIRNLETSIFLSNVDRTVHTMAISSATPGEGKSTVAISLATVLAADEKNEVVIVDADLRKPRIHKAFGLEGNKGGLSGLFDGSITDIEEVCRVTEIPRVFCIPAGAIPRDPVTLLRSGNVRPVVDALKERFSYVVFDTAPILGFADTPLLCRHVDGLVVVARQGQARRDELKEALQVIRSVDDIKLLGVVMNKASAGWGYGYSYRYGGHYYYRNYKYYSG